MTNSERINSHNVLIDEAIAKANALPDAGSGGGNATIENVEITFSKTYDNGLGFTDIRMYTSEFNTETGKLEPGVTRYVFHADDGDSPKPIPKGTQIVFVNTYTSKPITAVNVSKGLNVYYFDSTCAVVGVMDDCPAAGSTVEIDNG